MGSSRKIFSGIVWSVLANVLNATYGFIATPLLIRYFGRSEYGLISLATSINGYMAIMDLGLSSTNVRFFASWIAKGEKKRVKKLMQTCTAFYGIIGLINAIILLSLTFFSDKIFNVSYEQNSSLIKMLLILALTAIINWYTSCYGQIISATENVAWVQKRNIITKLLMIIVVVITLTVHFSIVQYFFAVSTVGFIILPATIKKIRKEINYISFFPKFDLEVFKEILPYSLGIFSFAIFQTSYQNLRPIFVGIRGTIEAVTDYGIIMSIAGLVTLVGRVFIGALLPSSSRIVSSKDTNTYNTIAYKGTHYITMVLCFCSFGLITISKDLIIIYVGTEYIHLIPWLNIWLILTITSNVSAISSLILAGNNIKPLIYSSAVASIMGLAACWITIPYLQVGGAIVAMIVYNCVQQLFYYIYLWPKILHINSWRIFIHTDIPFLITGGSLAYFINQLPHFNNHWLNVTIYGILFCVAYTTLTSLILKKEDRKYIWNLVQKQL